MSNFFISVNAFLVSNSNLLNHNSIQSLKHIYLIEFNYNLNKY